MANSTIKVRSFDVFCGSLKADQNIIPIVEGKCMYLSLKFYPLDAENTDIQLTFDTNVFAVTQYYDEIKIEALTNTGITEGQLRIKHLGTNLLKVLMFEIVPCTTKTQPPSGVTFYRKGDKIEDPLIINFTKGKGAYRTVLKDLSYNALSNLAYDLVTETTTFELTQNQKFTSLIRLGSVSEQGIIWGDIIDLKADVREDRPPLPPTIIKVIKDSTTITVLFTKGSRAERTELKGTWLNQQNTLVTDGESFSFPIPSSKLEDNCFKLRSIGHEFDNGYYQEKKKSLWTPWRSIYPKVKFQANLGHEILGSVTNDNILLVHLENGGLPYTIGEEDFYKLIETNLDWNIDGNVGTWEEMLNPIQELLAKGTSCGSNDVEHFDDYSYKLDWLQKTPTFAYIFETPSLMLMIPEEHIAGHLAKRSVVVNKKKEGTTLQTLYGVPKYVYPSMRYTHQITINNVTIDFHSDVTFAPVSCYDSQGNWHEDAYIVVDCSHSFTPSGGTETESEQNTFDNLLRNYLQYKDFEKDADIWGHYLDRTPNTYILLSDMYLYSNGRGQYHECDWCKYNYHDNYWTSSIRTAQYNLVAETDYLSYNNCCNFVRKFGDHALITVPFVQEDGQTVIYQPMVGFKLKGNSYIYDENMVLLPNDSRLVKGDWIWFNNYSCMNEGSQAKFIVQGPGGKAIPITCHSYSKSCDPKEVAKHLIFKDVREVAVYKCADPHYFEEEVENPRGIHTTWENVFETIKIKGLGHYWFQMNVTPNIKNYTLTTLTPRYPSLIYKNQYGYFKNEGHKVLTVNKNLVKTRYGIDFTKTLAFPNGNFTYLLPGSLVYAPKGDGDFRQVCQITNNYAANSIYEEGEPDKYLHWISKYYPICGYFSAESLPNESVPDSMRNYYPKFYGMKDFGYGSLENTEISIPIKTEFYTSNEKGHEQFGEHNKEILCNKYNHLEIINRDPLTNMANENPLKAFYELIEEEIWKRIKYYVYTVGVIETLPTLADTFCLACHSNFAVYCNPSVNYTIDGEEFQCLLYGVRVLKGTNLYVSGYNNDIVCVDSLSKDDWIWFSNQVQPKFCFENNKLITILGYSKGTNSNGDPMGAITIMPCYVDSGLDDPIQAEKKKNSSSLQIPSNFAIATTISRDTNDLTPTVPNETSILRQSEYSMCINTSGTPLSVIDEQGVTDYIATNALFAFLYEREDAPHTSRVYYMSYADPTNLTYKYGTIALSGFALRNYDIRIAGVTENKTDLYISSLGRKIGVIEVPCRTNLYHTHGSYYTTLNPGDRLYFDAEFEGESLEKTLYPISLYKDDNEKKVEERIITKYSTSRSNWFGINAVQVLPGQSQEVIKYIIDNKIEYNQKCDYTFVQANYAGLVDHIIPCRVKVIGYSLHSNRTIDPTDVVAKCYQNLKMKHTFIGYAELDFTQNYNITNNQ